MATTILPKKSNNEQPVATDDDHHEQMASDPSIPQFPQGSTFGSTNSFNGPSSFGSSFSGGLNNPSIQQPQQYTPTNTSQGFGMNGSVGQSSLQVVQNQGESLKNTGGAMQEGADVLVKNDNTDWINKKWRPAMGWIYMLTCTADFVIFPILWSILQALSKGNVTSQWQPLTLQGAGLYHIAMGAVLGIAAYGRTKEKIEGAAK